MSCDAASLGFHRCTPEPPKLKFETALELLDIQLDRLKDEAFWCAAPPAPRPPARQHASTPPTVHAPAEHALSPHPDPSPDPNLHPE